MIYVVGPNDKEFNVKGKKIFDVTSTSKDFCKELSPFYLGPVKLYDGYVSETLENAWQYCKVYEEYDFFGYPNMPYFEWAKKGWSNSLSVKHPMGKEAVHKYVFYAEESLDVVEARMKVFIPLYARCAKKTEAITKLKELHDNKKDIVLLDLDGYNTKEDMKKIITNPTKPFGHAFVIKMILEGLF
jgi:hypothetical protein